MELKKRIEAFGKLGEKLNNLSELEFLDLCARARSFNNWFTEENIGIALKGISKFLQTEHLSEWISQYSLTSSNQKTVGVIMAGNIPLVGFHDYLVVLISNNKIKAKISSQDPYLIRQLSQWLIEIEPEFENRIQFVDILSNFDAVIATGSNNSARYFEQYFSKYPHIIRKNRSSCAVINGQETEADVKLLGLDLFQYYGLGCRNVSKLYVPKDYDFQFLLDNLKPFEHVLDHHKYANNYDYNKSIYLVNKIGHLDTGYLLLKEDVAFVSPISVLFFEYFNDLEELNQKIALTKANIQCIVSKNAWFAHSVSFGESQQPNLSDYADGVDTMDFLQKLV